MVRKWRYVTFIFPLALIGAGIFAGNTAAEDAVFKAVVEDYLSLELNDENMSVDVGPSKTFSSGYVTATVNTNAAAGYVLSFQDADERNGLEREGYAEATDKTPFDIPSVTADTEYASLVDDTWGYFLGDTTDTAATYKEIPLATTEIATSDVPVADAVSRINFGVKIATTRPSGLYEDTLTFTAVTNIASLTLEESYAAAGKSKTAVSGDQYYAMQDMTAGICDATTEIPSELQVVDTRDQKIYWIAKLADGHCWMTQNLDLDLSTTKKLTHADTDLGWTTLNTNAEWTPERDTIAFDSSTTTTVSGWTNSYTDPYSADPGTQYVVSSGTTDNDAVFYTLETCMNNNTPDITTDDRTAGECSHYHTGNYYNWTAAIASNDSTVISTQYDVAPDSICPAGWRLSQGLTAETQTEEVASEWNKLLVAQGITSKWGETDENTGYTTDGFKNIRHTPLFLVRAGVVVSGSLYNRASYGYYWSSSVCSSTNAYRLYFYSSSVSPSGYNHRYSGFAARCVARGAQQ